MRRRGWIGAPREGLDRQARRGWEGRGVGWERLGGWNGERGYSAAMFPGVILGPLRSGVRPDSRIRRVALWRWPS